MKDLYILKDKNPVAAQDVLEWGKWYETADRTVEKTTIGECLISTVFLGLDHSLNGGTPVLFETMIFGGKEDGYQQRYCTWDEAVIGHKEACELLK